MARKSRVGRAEVKDADKVPLVFAYHEIIEAPEDQTLRSRNAAM